MNEPARLPDDLLDYLAAAREPEPTPAATKERLLARLGPFLPPVGGGGTPTDGGGGGVSPDTFGGGTTGAATGATAGTVATGATAAIGHGKWVIATVSALLGAGGGAAMHATLAPERTVTVIVSATAAGSVAPPIEAPSVATSVEAPPAAPSLVTSAPNPSGEPAAPRKSSLRAERILLEAANAALMRGDHAAALASLRQHARTFPKGDLAQERDLLMAQATRLQQSEKGSTPR